MSRYCAEFHMTGRGPCRWQCTRCMRAGTRMTDVVMWAMVVIGVALLWMMGGRQ